jgi:hypothetical protein
MASSEVLLGEPLREIEGTSSKKRKFSEMEEEQSTHRYFESSKVHSSRLVRCLALILLFVAS